MKIYWKNKDLSPPKGVKFALFPFYPHKKPLYLDPVEQIETLPCPTKPIPILKKELIPSYEQWATQIASFTAHRPLDKVVFARVCKITCKTKPDPLAICAKLQQIAPNATIFCLFNQDEAFLGATPETLFCREKRNVYSEALAGTIRRGKTPIEDEMLANTLFKDPKIHNEFSYVNSFIEEKLTRLCNAKILQRPLFVKKTPTVQHLCRSFNGQLKDRITDFDLIKNLHPTPALCGMPQKEALNYLAENELFDRKYFGSTFGWWTEEASHFSVLIRSCWIQGSTVHLYTGAGIVQLSDPEKEWEELDYKMSLYSDIFV